MSEGMNKKIFKKYIIEEDTLVNKLKVALDYVRDYYAVEGAIEQFHRAKEQTQEEMNSHWKWRLGVTGGGLLFAICSVSSSFGGYGYSFFEVLIGLVLGGVAGYLSVKFWKNKGNEIQQCIDKSEELQSAIDEVNVDFEAFGKQNGHLIHFIPQEYWYLEAIEYFYNAVSTGAAKDLNQAIQQYNTYEQQQKVDALQQTVYEQNVQLQRQVSAMKELIR